MSKPTIGVVIATPGRASIFRTLQSITYQGLIPGDDIIVVGDGLHEPTKKLVEAFGAPFRYVATRQTRTWGHDQVNYGLKMVGGDVVVLQDDDDIFAPRAFEEIRNLVSKVPKAPILGRVRSPYLGLLWQEAGPKAVLDGHCLVVPNDKEKLGYYTREYAGDQAYIKTCLEPYEEVYWADRVWTITRPTWKLYPRAIRSGAQAQADGTAEPLWRWMQLLMPSIEARLFTGDDDWTWYFYEAGWDSRKYGPPPITGAVKMYRDGERMMATFVTRPGASEHTRELLEFILWASQGLATWVYVDPSDEDTLTILKDLRYESHMVLNNVAEWTHDWPPTYFIEKKEEKSKIILPGSAFE